ncbi:MAG TPA: DUF1499 domain-containing protein [Rubrivivax sp.]
MTLLKTLLAAVAGIGLFGLLAAQLGLLSGKAPTDLGVREGRLKAPSKTDNSVSSQASSWPGSEGAQIAPLAARGDLASTMQRLKNAVASMSGAKVIEARPDYLYVQFTTRWMKFVDDAEFWADPVSGAIQVRSASRVGRKDFGVNRARVETIRERLAAP